MRSLAKYVAYICSIFFRIFLAYATLTGRDAHNRDRKQAYSAQFGHFSIQFVQRLIVYTGNCLPPKIFNGLESMLDKENAEKCDCMCGNMRPMCEYMHIFGCGIIFAMRF